MTWTEYLPKKLGRKFRSTLFSLFQVLQAQLPRMAKCGIGSSVDFGLRKIESQQIYDNIAVRLSLRTFKITGCFDMFSHSIQGIVWQFQVLPLDALFGYVYQLPNLIIGNLPLLVSLPLLLGQFANSGLVGLWRTWTAASICGIWLRMRALRPPP